MYCGLRFMTVFRLGIVLALSCTGYATSFKVIYTFGTNGGVSDGYLPHGTLISDSSGNLYGTTIAGGAANNGTVFELTPGSNGVWTEKILYSFSGGTDGGQPYAGVVFDSNGNLYGTTIAGGLSNSNCSSSGCGVVFELSPSGGGWNETVLYRFTGGADGGAPQAPVVLDSSGNVYGTTNLGGYNGNGVCTYGCGVVFELVKANGWGEKVLHSFEYSPVDGAFPLGSGLIFDGKNLIGTTNSGGNIACCGVGDIGTVFALKPQPNGTWTESILYVFCIATNCADGEGPASGVVLNGGKLYGTTNAGGRGSGAYGTFFELELLSGKWKLHDLTFAGSSGSAALEPVTLHGGTTYGVTQQGGIANGACTLFPYGNGVVYQVAKTSSGFRETVLYSFTGGTDGCGPAAGLAVDASGNLFGTTFNGGGGINGGVVFEVAP